MEMRQLEAFVRVTELGSFSRAAEALMLTQPAVTRQVAGLERELHAPLLERLGRRVKLTPAGEALYPYASEVVRLAGDAARAVGDVKAGLAGRLNVGASSTAATYILPPRLRAFRERYPGVEINVRTGASARVAEMVVSGAVDVGVVTDFRGHKGLHQVFLGDHTTGAVVYPGHPLENRGDAPGGVTPGELADHGLVLMQRGTNLRTYVDGLFSAAGAAPQVTMELDSVEAIKKMVEARLGISLLPLVSVGAEVEAGRLSALPLSAPQGGARQIHLIYREGPYLPAATRALIEGMKDSDAPHMR